MSDNWKYIEALYKSSAVSAKTKLAFRDFRQSSKVYTKGEGNPDHYCSFFVPYDPDKKEIYLGHHKKANDWIPPGGHIEPGETPIETSIREMQEELSVVITPNMLTPFALSVTKVGREAQSCLTHYDIWHLVKIRKQPFEYLESEYYDADWFPLSVGLAKISKNPQFRAVLEHLL